MEILKDRYTITELSERLGVTDHALRYYEKEFCLQVPKDERGRRYYTTDLANTMFQIKNMRDEGLEIKAIKKILQPENVVNEAPPIILDDDSISIVPSLHYDNTNEIRQFFSEFKDQITTSISQEVCTATEHLEKEISKTKLELGACVENSMRRLETKMEKHFEDVDRSISLWREKNKKGLAKRLLSKVFK
ncbi:MAG: MerR family transcriptional regulator [Clostridia bacterium]|nr:MerR family transcriptional regulator [Clostridia bacterium]